MSLSLVAWVLFSSSVSLDRQSFLSNSVSCREEVKENGDSDGDSDKEMLPTPVESNRIMLVHFSPRIGASLSV